MKHQYERYIEFLDQYIEALTDKDTGEVFLKSLLANKATLERHEPKESGNYFSPDYEVYCQDGCSEFPCPSLLDVTNQLDLVMGASNG